MAKAKYSEGEKILCFHGPLLYEAKCLQVDIQEGQMKYFVHYQGWNKNWDEWVTDARMMKFNAVGLQKQKELKEAFAKPGGQRLKKAELQRQAYPMPEALRHLEGSLSAAAPSTSASAVTVAELPGAVAAAVPEEQPAALTPPPLLPLSAPTPPQPPQTPTPPPAVAVASLVAVQPQRPAPPIPRLRASLQLPERLRHWLADDQDLVNNQCKLLRLPAGPRSVVRIADDFVSSSGDEAAADCRRQFSDGLLALFNAALGSRLLYKFERPQFAGLLKSQRSALPAGVYGAAHLLRLLAGLADLLPAAGVPAEPACRLLAECQRFLAFLDEHCDSYLTVDSYEVASPDYQRLALSI